MFYNFINDKDVRLIGCEAAGRGIHTGETAATISTGSLGVFHGMKSYFCQNEYGQIAPVYSISAGLDYPGVGPEHAYLHDIGRAEYVAVTDDEAVEAFEKSGIGEINVILMDIMMPEMDGIEAMCKIREISNVPVILLTAKSEDTDKILGLSMGADDYVTKPYNPQELAARVRSQLRRYTLLGDVHAEKREGEIVNGRLSYDPERRELKADGELVKLTATELKIVDLLMRNPGRVFPAEEIYQRVWQSDSYACENTVMVHIRRIREKIELNPKEPDYIKVVWGIGYKMEQHN